MSARPDIAEGKSCGECGLCCKLIGVESISKPQFVWCKSYRKGVGCKVYDDRPSDCRAFVCYWMHTPNLGEEWRPDRCGFVMHIADGGTRLNIEVDPGSPLGLEAGAVPLGLPRLVGPGARPSRPDPAGLGGAAVFRDHAGRRL